MDTNENPKECNCALSVILKATSTLDIKGDIKIPVIKNRKAIKVGSKLIVCVPNADEPDSKRQKTH